MMSEALSSELKLTQDRIQQLFQRWLPAPAQLPAHLSQAIHYVALSKGKRLRPMLCYATAHCFQSAPETVDALATAIELLHTYSLVHDDLPAMDDDALRRGQPTCHVAFDEATAILVGDALQSLAFELLATPEVMPIDAALQLKIIQQLAYAIGSHGMVRGQALDLTESAVNNLHDLTALHSLKTGRLIQACVTLSALAVGASTNEVQALKQYGEALGIAFQIQDDILDVEADIETLGKTPGKDAMVQKPTFVSLVGLDKAKVLARQHHAQAVESLSSFGEPAALLRATADYSISRTH